MYPRAAVINVREYAKKSPGNRNYSSPLVADSSTDYRAYNMDLVIINQGGPQVVQDGCFALMFTNVGTEPVKVNGKILFPFAAALPLTGIGDSFTLGGHLRDLYYGAINIEFLSTTVQPALEMIQLFYVGALKNRVVQK